MTEHRRLKPIADRVQGHTLSPTERTELPTPGGLTIADDPVAGAHLRTEYRRVGQVNGAGEATIEERSHRTVVAVTVGGTRVPFDPDVWARWMRVTDRGMGGWA